MRGIHDEHIKVNRSCFVGQRKCSRGRFQVGNRKEPKERQVRQELEVEVEVYGEADSSSGEDDDELTGRLCFRKNYKGRVVGPRVVGVYESRAEGCFFIVGD